jgi:hypothetical protein
MRIKHRFITTVLALTVLISLALTIPAPSHAQDAAGDLLARINGLRAALGLAPYSLNGALSSAALNQAAWMAATGQISHTQPDGSTPSSRAQANGYPSSAVSENIYMGTRATADSAWQWWLSSPVHYRGITNPSFTEVGIGSAAGEFGSAFVLVFGNPAGWGASSAVAQAARPAGSGQEAAAPPAYVVGLDQFGNIMHEIQPDQTLGDIALIYGYGWDIIPYVLTINGLTQDDIRQLSVGAVLLVPPHSGTYTPTPGGPLPTPLAEVTTDVIDLAALAAAAPATPFMAITVLPTSTPTLVEAAPLAVTSAQMPAGLETTAEATVTTATVTTATLTPESTASPTPQAAPMQVAAASAAWSAATITPAPGTAVAMIGAGPAAPSPLQPENSPASGGTTTPLLIVAIGLQVVIIGLIGAQFLRRGRAVNRE